MSVSVSVSASVSVCACACACVCVSVWSVCIDVFQGWDIHKNQQLSASSIYMYTQLY